MVFKISNKMAFAGFACLIMLLIDLTIKYFYQIDFLKSLRRYDSGLGKKLVEKTVWIGETLRSYFLHRWKNDKTWLN